MTYILGALWIGHTAKDNVGSFHNIHGSVLNLSAGFGKRLALQNEIVVGFMCELAIVKLYLVNGAVPDHNLVTRVDQILDYGGSHHSKTQEAEGLL